MQVGVYLAARRFLNGLASREGGGSVPLQGNDDVFDGHHNECCSCIYLKLYLQQPSQHQLHLLNPLSAKQRAYFSALGLITAKLHKPGSETDERQVMNAVLYA